MTKEEILKMTKEELYKYIWNDGLGKIVKDNCYNCENCEDCSWCHYCKNSKNIRDCHNCKNCENCEDCEDLNYCYECRNAKDLKYAICNVEMTKEEYENKLKELNK